MSTQTQTQTQTPNAAPPAPTPPACVVTLTLNPAIDRTVTIPRFGVGQVNRVSAAQDRPGGKGINVATTLADLGDTVAAAGCIGRENASGFVALFSARGIQDRCLRLAGATRVGIKIMDPDSQETTDINFPGLSPAAADLATLRAQLLEAARPGVCFALAGSLPPGVPPTIYAELTAALRQRGTEVLVDTSGEPLRQVVEAAILPTLLKPNIHELEALLGRTLPDPMAVLGAARELLGRGVDWVVVSMGAAGAVFVSAQEALLARPPAVTVRSTVGAGDALVAGILHGRVHGLDLAATARLATGLSLDRLSHLAPGISSRAAVAALAAQVSVIDLQMG